MTNELGLAWLKKVLKKYTTVHIIRRYEFFILFFFNGHTSHKSGEIDFFSVKIICLLTLQIIYNHLLLATSYS
jgi:hypothetical protein